jgi:CO/xanthine dehydrogenase FAD-binding subunit
MLNQFELFTPTTVAEAVSILSQNPDCKIVAGGTDVFVEMHAGKKIACLMDIKGIEALKGMQWSEQDGLYFGALTTYAEIERFDAVKKYYPALIDASCKTGSTQIRMKGTLAGNICTASPAGDSTGALLAYDAIVHVEGPAGKRSIQISEFFSSYKKTALKEGELVTGISMPPPAQKTGSASIKFTRRKAMDIGILSCCVRITLDNENTCENARIALLSVSPTPIRIYQAEEFLVGRQINDETVQEAAEICFRAAQPKTWRADEEYSKELVKTVVPQTIEIAVKRLMNGEN